MEVSDELPKIKYPDRYEPTVRLLEQLLISINKTIYCAREDDKLTILASVDREGLLTFRLRWPEDPRVEWVIYPATGGRPIPPRGTN
jgi:hypothetical protein